MDLSHIRHRCADNQAVDLHYWQTNNLEWYEPRRLTTVDGHLRVTLNNTPSHGLDYEGGMMQTWNRFCFTGGYIEASVSLPGRSDVAGLWPAVWTMGNLGRAGYGGSLDGMWPYTYDSCDVGTLANQSLNGMSFPSSQSSSIIVPRQEARFCLQHETGGIVLIQS